MKYFIDTEFIESFHKPLFGKRRHFIDLISIGIVAEDGREYYAISKEYNYKDASEWVKENVITQLYREQNPGFKQQFMNLKTFHKYTPISKTNKQIRSDLYQFITCPKGDTVDFYGYYSDYDWVLFCSLFGTMMDLPRGLPMYCNDLKQTLDEFVMKQTIGVDKALKDGVYPIPDKHRKSIPLLFDEMLEDYKKTDEYPKQTNEHNALSDARWNKKLFDFLKNLNGVAVNDNKEKV